jgi:cytoskeletal protein CcmA (bactofilin family)
VHAQRYRLHGTGKILAEVDVEEGLFDGLLSIGGNLTADRIRSEGSLEVGGDVTIRDRFLSHGSLRVSGSLVAGSAELRGLSRVAKDVSVDTQLSHHGTLEVGGRLSVALFSPDGRFTIGGGLTAREIIGTFDGESRVGTIEAPRVTLRPKAWVRLPIDLPPLRPKGSLVVDRIEADSVNLEGVTVHYLKAPTIVLGRHCHVTQADGQVVRRDRSSHVGFESRSPPPPGMSR